jgi:hypothetical protein
MVHAPKAIGADLHWLIVVLRPYPRTAIHRRMPSVTQTATVRITPFRIS